MEQKTKKIAKKTKKMMVFSCDVFTTDTTKMKERDWKWEPLQVPIANLRGSEDITISIVEGTIIIVKNSITINADSGWGGDPYIFEGTIKLIVPLGTSPKRRRKIKKALKGNPFNAI